MAVWRRKRVFNERGSQLDRDVLFMSAYPTAMTEFRMSNYRAVLKDERVLLPVVYTTIRTTGNPWDMVASRGRGDRRVCG